MNHSSLHSLALSVILFVSAASRGVSASEPDQRSKAVRLALSTVCPLRFGSLSGYVAAYLREADWPSHLKDNDIGPFLQAKASGKADCIVLLFPPENADDPTYSIYIRSGAATAVAACPSESRSSITTSSVNEHSKPVRHPPNPRCADRLQFVQATLPGHLGAPISVLGLATKEGAGK